MDTTALLTLHNAQSHTQTQAQKTLSAAMNTSRDQHGKLGQDFEAMCLSQMLAPMFEGLTTDGPFGGGHGEEAMRSFYIGAIAEQMAKRGGLGISDLMQKELLKLQGAA